MEQGGWGRLFPLVPVACAVGWLPVFALAVEVRGQRWGDPALTVLPLVAFALGLATACWAVQICDRWCSKRGRLRAVGFSLGGGLVCALASMGDAVCAGAFSVGCVLLGMAEIFIVHGAEMNKEPPFGDRQLVCVGLTIFLAWVVAAWLACQGPLFLASVLSGIAMAVAAWLLRDSGAKGDVREASSISNLTRQRLWSLQNRQGLAAMALGFSFASMADLLSPAEPHKAMHWSWWVLLAAVAIAGALFLVDQARRGEPDYWFDLRLSVFFAIVAFFPFDALNVFGIKAAFWGLECGFVLSTLFLALVVAKTRMLLADVAPVPVVVPLAAYGCGAALGVMVGRLVFAGDETSVRSGGLLALVLVFCATNLLLKEDAVRSIRIVHAGQTPLSVPASSMAQDYVDRACRELAARYVLSERELDVLYLLARGHSLARIQEELFISEGTASTHRRHVYKKLEVRNKQELIELVEMWRA